MRGRRCARGRGARRPGLSSRGSTTSRPLSPFTATPLVSPQQSGPSAETTGSAATNDARSIITASIDSPETVTIERVFEECKAVKDKMERNSGRLRAIEEKTSRILSALKELSDLTKKYCRSSFVIKGSPYEAPIKSEMAKLFCHSLRRKPSNKEIQEALVHVLGGDSREKYRFDIAFTYAKNKLTEFRTEEQRKVIGIGPYESKPYTDTKSLCQYLISCMQPQDVDQDLYTKHLAILRKFVRESLSVPSNNFYNSFREWIDENFSTLDEEAWDKLLSEDAEVDYETVGSGITEAEEQYYEEECILNDGIITQTSELTSDN